MPGGACSPINCTTYLNSLNAKVLHFKQVWFKIRSTLLENVTTLAFWNNGVL